MSQPEETSETAKLLAEGAPGTSGTRGEGTRPENKPRFPRRERVVNPVPSLQQELRPKPSLKDLDAEIASDLEAAMAGISEKDFFAAESATAARQSGESQPARKKGKVMSVHGADVFVDVPGGRSQGVLPLAQFPDGPPKVGSEVEFEIEGYDGANGLLILTRCGAAVVADWSSVAEGMIVEARVLETNKGGLAVDVNGIRGFMPISQIDLYRVDNAEQFVNQRLVCMVAEVNKDERKLVVSRRALLEKERAEARDKLWTELAEGQVREGIVRNIRDFGAFIDLGGVDGLLPVGEMSWQRVKDPASVVQMGQRLKVVVLRLDRDARKVSLGLKQLLPSPWDNIEERFHVGSLVSGTVTRLMDFGAFVELEPGVEGLVHISELAPQRVRRVGDIVQTGQEVQVIVLGVDAANRKMSLSLKAALAKQAPAEPAETEQEETAAAKPIRPRTTPLRGGVGNDWSLPAPDEQ